MLLWKADPLQAAPEAPVHLNSPLLSTSQLAATVWRCAAHYLAGFSGVHCPRWMPLGQALLRRRAHATRDLTQADREAARQRHREGSSHRRTI